MSFVERCSFSGLSRPPRLAPWEQLTLAVLVAKLAGLAAGRGALCRSLVLVRLVIERVILIHVEGFDWNCPQHIMPRYTIDELQEVLAPVREKLATLEAENATLRDKLSLLPT